MTTAYPLYDPKMEHESCGVGAVGDLGKQATHRTVSFAHRPGSDAAGTTGDGVGILTQLPHRLFSRWARDHGVHLGNADDYAVGVFFLPDDEIAAENICRIFKGFAGAEGLSEIAWRGVSDIPIIPGLFAAGDMHSGQLLVVRAIADGRAAAIEVNQFLMGC